MPALSAREAKLRDIHALREVFRAESDCQVVHDSLHDRRGWTVPYLLFVDGKPAGFAAIAISGPWKGKRSVFDFYLIPDHRAHFRPLIETFLDVSAPDSLEIQTNLPMASEFIGVCGQDLATDAVVFGDATTTDLPANEAILRPETSEREIAGAIAERAGSADWVLELGGKPVGKGSLLFHYNVPYADVAMEIDEPFRRRGFGSYLVQELKRHAYRLGARPAARSAPTNFPSHATLRRAGFKPVGKIVSGTLKAR